MDLCFRVIGCNTGANQPERRGQPVNDINVCLMVRLQHLTPRNPKYPIPLRVTHFQFSQAQSLSMGLELTFSAV